MSLGGEAGMQGRELSDAWQQYAGMIEAEVDANQASIAAMAERKETFAAAAQAAARELAAVFVPELTAEALARAEALTGFRGFSRFEPIKAMERERQKLEGDLAAVRADERFQRREYLVGPYGEITRRLEEAKGMLEPWEKECQAFELLDGFTELLETGYDTPEFSVRWWESRYWRIWATGDRICELLGMADFGDDVLPAYMKVRTPRDQWRARVQEVMNEVHALHELVRRHDRDQARLQDLGSIYHGECLAALGAHLESADPALIESWSPEDRAVVVGARKLAGCRAKVELTDELIAGLGGLNARLREDEQKAERKSAKFVRAKNFHAQFAANQQPPADPARLEKLRASRERFDEALERIERYQEYERFDVQQNDPALWYLEMTGRRPSPHCSELRGWYDRNPQASVVRVGGDPDDAVFRAAGELGPDDLGDVS
jgi:hypothetical protein